MKYIITLLVAVIFITNQASAQQTGDPIPADKGLSKQWYDELYHDHNQAVYRGEQLKTIGMPIGGIAAGQLYIRGDGTFARWWIANNAYNTGCGSPGQMNMVTPFGIAKNCYQTYTPESYVDQGFKISIKTASGKSFTKKLNKEDFDNVSFIGEYPIAIVNYEDKRTPLPVSITMKAFTPFIPLDAKESATPGTYIIFKLKNTSKEKLNISLAGWLQNMVCEDLTGKAAGTLRNRAISDKESASLVMDMLEDKRTSTIIKKETVFDDFESGNYNNWTVTGDAFADKPAKGNLPDQNTVDGYSGEYLVNSFYRGDDTKGTMTSKEFVINDDYINFLIGGGNLRGLTCMNLVVDGQIVMSETGNDSEVLSPKGWNVTAWKGRKAHLQIVDNATGPWGHINVDRIVFSNTATGWINDLKNHPYMGNVALTILDANGEVITNIDNNSKAESTKKLGDNLVGQVGTKLWLAPGEERDIVFMLTWFFPNRPQQYNGFNFGNALPTAGPAIGNMYANWYSSAPDVAHWMRDNRQRLTTLTDLFHDTYYNHTSLPYWLNQRIMMPVSTLASETCEWWGDGKFYAYEGVGSCNGTCTHVWNYEQALAHLFPELERNIREKTDFGTSFQDDGGISTRNGEDGVKIDGHAGGILKAYREYLLSDNPNFLSRNWDKIKRATLYIIHQDSLDGKIDGMIGGQQPNTYDVAFYGANTYVGSLYLAALQSAQKMAIIMNDQAFADTCKAIYEMGREQTIKRLWTGQYFKQDVDSKKYPDEQYGDGCLSDQLFGQTWAHILDLGYVYPEDMVRKTLASTWKYNWTTDVGAYNKIHEPGRFYASDKEPGLLITTWPQNDYMKTGVMYKDEVWTGVEYQVATNMIYDNMIDEGLSIVKGINERYSPEKHNPWNEVECGDHYARAMASWGVLLALEDYNYNGPEGELSFAPKLTPQNFESFFTTAKGWGNLSQQQLENVQKDELQLKYGELRLKQFTINMVGNTVPKTVSLYIDGKNVDVKWERDGQEVIIHDFDQTLYAGQTLKAEIGTAN
jgi:non-lysosomal glucosylceramidase